MTQIAQPTIPLQSLRLAGFIMAHQTARFAYATESLIHTEFAYTTRTPQGVVGGYEPYLVCPTLPAVRDFLGY